MEENFVRLNLGADNQKLYDFLELFTFLAVSLGVLLMPIVGISFYFMQFENVRSRSSVTHASEEPHCEATSRNEGGKALLSSEGDVHASLSQPTSSGTILFPAAVDTFPREVIQWCRTTSHYTPSSRVEREMRIKYGENSRESSPLQALTRLSRPRTSGEPSIDFVLKSGQGLCQRESEELDHPSPTSGGDFTSWVRESDSHGVSPELVKRTL
eukprot:gb/GEZN01012281.1/.p1 GENE.gb/GEZN01012281.1/~~gb/GEZN01012281.1/.p1  ORF type:complete len:213 (-),score=14.28 gb/GEZN01012281.1/:346-984(-)